VFQYGNPTNCDTTHNRVGSGHHIEAYWLVSEWGNSHKLPAPAKGSTSVFQYGSEKMRGQAAQPSGCNQTHLPSSQGTLEKVGSLF